MIPDLTLSALENGFGHFGVASNNNKTRHVDTLGVNVDSKNSTLTCYVRNDETKEVLEFLNESGRISFFVGMITHEAYNFKGQFVEVINLSKDELVFLRLFMRDGWFYCDVRNKSLSERQLFNSIQKKLSQELINA